MKDRVEILLASYNGANYITEQLESIFCQTYQNFQVIIRDDCSVDETINIVEQFAVRFPGRIQLIRGEKNLGACGNFAALAGLAATTKTDYVMFSDGDDIWLPNKIEKTLAVMKEAENSHGKHVPHLVHTDLTVVNKRLECISHSFWHYSKLNVRADSINRLLMQNIVTGCTMMLNRQLLELSLPIPKEAIMHDWWIALVAASFGHISSISSPTILYRQHEKNDTGAKKMRGLGAYLGLIKKAANFSGRVLMRSKIQKTIHQAIAFQNQYKGLLDENKKGTLQQYVSMKDSNFLKKRYILLKNGFLKNTFARNVGLFFLI